MADMIRVQRRKGFTVIPNEVAAEPKLSLKAKGLMLVLLSRPDGWEYSIAGLAAYCHCGRDAIRAAMKEIEAAGYMTRTQTHDERGKFAGTIYEIHDVSRRFRAPPEDAPAGEEAPADGDAPDGASPPLSENPATVGDGAESPLPGLPSSGLPTSGNPTQINIDYNIPPIVPQGGLKCGGNQKPKNGRRDLSAPKWKPERFAAFWDYYRTNARGESHKAAVRAWDKLKPDDELIKTIGLALRRQISSEQWKRGIGIPYASTYLNNRRWEDAPSAHPDDTPPAAAPGRVVETGVLPVW